MCDLVCMFSCRRVTVEGLLSFLNAAGKTIIKSSFSFISVPCKCQSVHEKQVSRFPVVQYSFIYILQDNFGFVNNYIWP